VVTLGEPDGGQDEGDEAPDATDEVIDEASSDAGDEATTSQVPGKGVNVLTQHNDLGRTGANLDENRLTVAVVTSAHFGKIFTRAVDDQIYAQPLVVSGVQLPGRGLRDVLYVATVNDTVYAFDADDPVAGKPIWKKSYLGAGVMPPTNTDMTGACGGHYSDFSGKIGIVGTPVIDPATGTMYFVARTKEAGNGGTAFVQRLHALDITDGNERSGSPVAISASVPGTGEGGTTITFDPLKENQRAGLLLLNGVVYITWAGHCDWGPYHGWIMGYDAATLEQVVVFNVTPNGNAGGIWQSGQAPASDGTSIYAISGNGTVGDQGDPRSVTNRGESFLKLTRSGSTMAVASWFTPYDHEYLEINDLDLGSAGLLLIPGTHLGVSGGKGGKMYVVNRDYMGGLTASATTDDNVIQTFVVNAPEHIRGSPIFWKGPTSSWMYVWGQTDHLKAFPFLGPSNEPNTPVFDTNNVVQSTVALGFGMPGAMLSVSANGDQAGTGIVWASHPLSGDANQEVRPGMFRAFDAEDVSHELWNTQMNAARDDCGDFAKFSYPTIANGRVYLASFSKRLCVYGVMP
jgi:hypothetical protein